MPVSTPRVPQTSEELAFARSESVRGLSESCRLKTGVFGSAWAWRGGRVVERTALEMRQAG